ncbi:GTPase ObgE [Gudongella sp. DL1XJH-153]|uniref:GTPase ObgE n=1 Tax=Gudongella sp. DL1XJH-153 TaxID=3409804 RepID=UPI003BB76D3C
MFIDVAKISVKAGKGGNGIVAWRREKYEPSGGPYGGDGGKGGSIVLYADEGIRTLMDFRYKRSYVGENGEDGRSKKQFGKDGSDIYLKVPVGTLVKDEETDKVIVDLKEPGQEFIIAKGGKGGRGNAKFATSTRQAPGFAEAGTKGSERNIILELKLLADVGLIGFPNVGKSTILSTMSAAKPKIANYHFTTLKPNLGVVRVEEEKSFVIADIPGLIEGASEGAGLGHDFLRHIERTRVLVHVLDASGSEERNPIEDFQKINDELFQYNEKLKDKPQIIVANKMDIPSSKEWIGKIKEEFVPKGYNVFEVSAATRDGIQELVYAIWNLLENTEIVYDTYDEEFIETIAPKRDEIIVKKDEERYVVEGAFMERLLESTYMEDSDSLRYFQEMLRKKGVIDRLKELGITEGESVFICDNEFEFFE